MIVSIIGARGSGREIIKSVIDKEGHVGIIIPLGETLSPQGKRIIDLSAFFVMCRRARNPKRFEYDVYDHNLTLKWQWRILQKDIDAIRKVAK